MVNVMNWLAQQRNGEFGRRLHVPWIRNGATNIEAFLGLKQINKHTYLSSLLSFDSFGAVAATCGGGDWTLIASEVVAFGLEGVLLKKDLKSR